MVFFLQHPRAHVFKAQELLFSLSGIGMIIDRIFTVESFMPHMAGFLLGAFIPVIGFLYAGRILRPIPAWHRLGIGPLVASSLTFLLLVTSLVTFNQANVLAETSIDYLAERILCLELSVWMVILSVKAYQQSP